MTLAEPSELFDVISVTPAIWVNCFSSGVATDAAMTSGLPPGSPALTKIVGKSTWGSGDTGRSVNEIAPASPIAIVSNVVATGRLIKGAETLIGLPAARWPQAPFPASSTAQDHGDSGTGRARSRHARRRDKLPVS